MPQSVIDFANVLYQAMLHKQWGILGAGALVALVAFLRWIAPKIHDKVGDFLNSQRGGALLALVGGISGALTTAFVAGQKFSLPLLGAGFMVGLGAIGGWNALWDIFAPKDGKSVMSMFKRKSKPDNAGPINVGMLPLIALPLAALLGATAISGCGYCWQDAHVSEPKCVVAHDIVACAEGDAADALGIATTILGALVGTGGVGQAVWDAVKEMAIKLGFKTGGCFWAKLQEYFNMPGATQAHITFMASCQAHFSDFKAHFGAPGVKFCVMKNGLQVCH